MSSNKIKNELDRREFMKRLLAGTGFITKFPGEIFLSNMMLHYLQKAHAQAAGLDDGFGDQKFINIGMDGGLPRWYWDGIINPTGSEIVVPNPMIISKFKVSGDNVLGEYGTTQVGKFHMPWVWSSNIPTADGGVVPMSALAENMMILRGINSLVDSHELNKNRHIAPVVGGISLTGLVADKSKAPVPAIHRVNGGGAMFGSEKGIASVDLTGDNPLTSALTPFLPGMNPIELKNSSIENAIDLALNRISEFSGSKNKYLPSTFETRQNAKNLMKKQFGDLRGTYDTIKNKYIKLMNRSFQATGNLSLSQVDDVPLIGSNSNPFEVGEVDYHIGDIQTVTNFNTRITGLAEAFAIAEYMLLEGLSSSANLIIVGFTDAFYEKTINSVTGRVSGPRNMLIFPDAHSCGSHVGLVMFSRYYRALSACLYEFIQQLKKKQTPYGNMFNHTTISITSEFNRTPLNTAKGSDHGWQGCVYSLFSGMVDELTVLGNVRTDDGGRYAGTWGAAGLVSELGNREALLGNAISTISAMTEVKTPTPNDKAFANKVNGKVVPFVKSAKNVSPDDEAA